MRIVYVYPYSITEPSSLRARQSRDRGMDRLLFRATFLILFRLEVIFVRSELEDQVETS